MALAPAFSCNKIPSVSLYNLTALTHVGSPICSRNLFLQEGKEVVLKPICRARNRKICITNHQKWPRLGLMLAASSGSSELAASSGSSFETRSLSDVVKKFYTCINEDDRKGLEGLIASNCTLEDSAFPYIVQGKKEVTSLFIQLATSMGENVHFKLGNVCEGDELTASVNWHLEWKDNQIPCSRGCSIFQCSIEEDRLLIRKIQILTESPVKPGILAMAMLKMVRSFFDEFPKAAKWFLKSPHIILRAVLNMYKLFLAPIVNPILTFYITIWKFIARILGYAISFLHIIAKYFNKNSSSANNDDDYASTTFEPDQEPESLQ